jgi:hypothetical protein
MSYYSRHYSNSVVTIQIRGTIQNTEYYLNSGIWTGHEHICWVGWVSLSLYYLGYYLPLELLEYFIIRGSVDAE